MVARKHWGKGYGRAITQYGINRLLDMGKKPALYFANANTPAKQLYASLGFRTAAVFRVMDKAWVMDLQIKIKKLAFGP